MVFYTGTGIQDKKLIGHRNGEQYGIMDDESVLAFFAENSTNSAAEFTHAVLSNEWFRGRDLTRLSGAEEAVSSYVAAIRRNGMRETMAVRDIPAGSEVIKYGFRIGNAKDDIKAGQWVHVHNVGTALGELLEYTYEPEKAAGVEAEKDISGRTFQGFRRLDESTGVRNEIWIIPTVGCVNNIAAAMARAANEKVLGSVDAVIAFPHPYGYSQVGEDWEHTRTILADLVKHPLRSRTLFLRRGV